jgi:hypothetical protein
MTVTTDSRPSTTVLPTTVAPPASPPTGLPHPEEKPDYSRNLENTSFISVMDKWFEIYSVPEQYRGFWQDRIAATVTVEISYPAGTWDQDGIRHLAVRPEWLNPGVIAHEQAHNSYALLTGSQKTEFSSIYSHLKETDSLIKLLYSINTYGLSNEIEGHAEVYRYLGEKMPEQLKKYYPKLF